MNIIQAIILGLIQGLTEFIPVSSSGHLVLAHHALGITDSGLAFDVALHAGTLIALTAYFRKDLVLLASSLIKKSQKTNLAWFLIVATVPGAVIGYMLESSAKTTFRSVRLVSATILGFGIIMLLAEYIYARQKSHKPLSNISLKESLAMGFAQALAIIPGVSRSGSTITTGLLFGLNRVAATRFSFLLGIPITFGAILKVFTENGVLHEVKNEQSVFIVGIIAAVLSGLFAIKFMLKYLSGHGLHVFAYYRIVLGASLLIIYGVR